MALDFVDWILNKKGSLIGQNKNGAQSVTIEAGAKVGKVQVFQSDASLLQQVVTVDSVAVFPIVEWGSLATWQQNEQLRRDVCQKLVTYLTAESASSSKQPETRELNKVKASLRVAALKNLLDPTSGGPARVVEQFLPGAKYSLVIRSTYASLLTLAIQLVPYLLSGIALTILSNEQTSIHVSYLIDLLAHFGLPSTGVLNQLIDFHLTNEGQIASFILLDDADIDSALDAALASQLVYGVPCVKIFAQDSLKPTIQQVIGHKLQIESPEEDLYLEDELFKQSIGDAKVNSDAVNFETNQSGLDVYYYRTTGEVLKMVNHLQGRLSQRVVSVWSEKTALALKVAQSVQSCRQVLINDGIASLGYGNSLNGWQFELIARSALSQLTADNTELPLKLAQLNKSWSSSVITRVRTVNSLLDSLKSTTSLNWAAIKLALHRTTEEVEEDETSVNKIFINYYGPIGQVIVQLSDRETIDDTCLLSFGLNALVYGNSLVLVGKSSNKQLAVWKKIQDLLDKAGFAGAVHTVASDRATKVEGDTTSQGALQLTGQDGRTVQAVFIEQDQFQQEYFARLLRRVRRSIAISLAEFDLAKIVE